jgi:hypothetical protein
MHPDLSTNLNRIRRIQSLAEELGHLVGDGDAQLEILDKILKEAHVLSLRIIEQKGEIPAKHRVVGG